MTHHKDSLRIGTSGFFYDHWREVFYPPGLPRPGWLGHYMRYFDTVEINATFYHLLPEKTFLAWRRQAEEDFCFAVKLSQLATHRKRLADPAATLEPFLERVKLLGSHLGPILVQLPPSWPVDADALDRFLAAAPRRQRWTVEVRHPSWLCDRVYRVLERHEAALCIHDKLDHPWRTTTDWSYVRFHGPQGGREGYSPQKLTAFARRIEQMLARDMDVYAYFNNDLEGHAVRNALTLRRYLTGQPEEEIAALSTAHA